MLFSIALILMLGFLTGILFYKIKIPKLVGMIIVGLIIGPFALNLLDPKILSISSELRQIALVIILTRAGLSLDVTSLKKIGRPAILMCFVPATFEIIGITIFGPMLLSITIFEALLLGSVLGAVSPAVVIPRMLRLQREKYGNENKIPELLMAGASADDVYVIILFYAFLGLVQNNSFDVKQLISIPTSILLGIVLGIIVGFMLSFVLKRIKLQLTIKVLITLSVSFMMITLESLLQNHVPISALLGVMAYGIVLFVRNKEDAQEIERGYSHIWTFFEIFLFVLVGATVDFSFALASGMNAILLLMVSLGFRSVGVLLCLFKTTLTWKERIFSILSYLPKATVQASIGGIALSLGLSSGNVILTVAVLSILITAPLGALLMDSTYKLLLEKTETV